MVRVNLCSFVHAIKASFNNCSQHCAHQHTSIFFVGNSNGPLPATSPPISLPYADLTLQVSCTNNI